MCCGRGFMRATASRSNHGRAALRRKGLGYDDLRQAKFACSNLVQRPQPAAGWSSTNCGSPHSSFQREDWSDSLSTTKRPAALVTHRNSDHFNNAALRTVLGEKGRLVTQADTVPWIDTGGLQVQSIACGSRCSSRLGARILLRSLFSRWTALARPNVLGSLMEAALGYSTETTRNGTSVGWIIVVPSAHSMQHAFRSMAHVSTRGV